MRRLFPLLFLVVSACSCATAADEIRKLGVEDLEFGQSTATSSGGVVSTQINASHIPMSSGSDNVDVEISNLKSNKIDTSTNLADASDGRYTLPKVYNDDVYEKFGTDNDFRVYYSASNNTLIIALDNGSSVCVFNKSLGMVCSGEITATQYNTSSPDGQRYIDASNSTAPTPEADSYPLYYDTAMHKLRVYNGSSWDNVALE